MLPMGRYCMRRDEEMSMDRSLSSGFPRRSSTMSSIEMARGFVVFVSPVLSSCCSRVPSPPHFFLLSPPCLSAPSLPRAHIPRTVLYVVT